MFPEMFTKCSLIKVTNAHSPSALRGSLKRLLYLGITSLIQCRIGTKVRRPSAALQTGTQTRRGTTETGYGEPFTPKIPRRVFLGDISPVTPSLPRNLGA